MSRFKKYAKSLASGYVQMGANVVFTLASVPLAFAFLSTEEFGVWALVTQLAGYLALIDLGMSSAIGRTLFDVKDDQNGGDYGSVIQTGLLVSTVQGLLLFLLGMLSASAFARALKIPEPLVQEFVVILQGQCLVTALGLPLRTFGHLLVAQHRWEITNYAHAFSFAINLVLLWLFLRLGWKLEALVASNAAALLVSSAITAIACRRLKLFPARGTWGRPTFRHFIDLMAFGKDAFLVAVGLQFIMASQTIIVTRAMGLEAAAVWSVCTKIYALLSQVVWRVYDFSASMFAEMIVRGERERLRERFRQVISITAAASVLAAITFAVINEPFVTLWTSGRVSWNNLNNILLAAWLVTFAVLRCQGGLMLLTKKVGFLRYIYFIEGGVFFVTAFFLAKSGGFPAILATSVVCTICFTGVYGIRRISVYLGVSAREFLLQWLAPAYRLAAILVPTAGVVWMATLEVPHFGRLVLNGVVVGTVGAACLLRFGLPSALRAEVMNRTPHRLRALIGTVLGAGAR